MKLPLLIKPVSVSGLRGKFLSAASCFHSFHSFSVFFLLFLKFKDAINLKNLVCSTVKHSFSGIFTASTGTSNLPEVVAVALVNNIEASYCDSKIEKAIPKQDWMENLRDGEPEYWKEYAQDCAVNRLFFEEQFHILKRRLNQTTSVHILQKVIGCEWDDETETSHGYQNYGFDGEDFLVFDLKTLTWIATKPQAVITKHYWDRQKTTNDLWKYYLTQVCVDWLKKHLKYGRISLMRTDLPSVSLLQKTPSSQVTCHATGFYPDRADLFWRKDGEELHEDVDKGEILPNHDGTFQMSVDLNISSIPAEDWKKYDCVFQMSDVKDDIITKLDKSVIRTNQSKTEMEIQSFAGASRISQQPQQSVLVYKRTSSVVQ
uniref:Ig-like domain-containing protein n=1 Tax=Amphiprion percula TaxID=161767 RepID=A0A3P8T5B1_AMPPE